MPFTASSEPRSKTCAGARSNVVAGTLSLIERIGNSSCLVTYQ